MKALTTVTQVYQYITVNNYDEFEATRESI